MKKTLRIVSVSAGILSVLSAIVLACIYFESILNFLKGKKNDFNYLAYGR